VESEIMREVQELPFALEWLGDQFREGKMAGSMMNTWLVDHVF
jgi:hypothetical protein